MTDAPKLRGFARLTPDERKALASRGGKSLRPEQRPYSQDRTLAANAGRLGGLKSRKPKKESNP